ncbi:FadR/GntR family transcriptional regulator [Chloroflexota bacterium]
MSEVKFQPLKVRRLSEIIEESIKDLILDGQLKPGSKLPTEKEISRQFSVSIVTVREALRGLEAYGIIQKKRGKDGGIFVTELDIGTVKSAMYRFLTSARFSAKDVSEVRRIVQPATVKIAASQITPEELKALEKNIKYCEKKIERTKKNFSENDFFEIEERNVEFHRLIGEATHNPVLALTVDYVEDFLLSFKKSALNPDIQFSLRTIRDHRTIYGDLQKGDAQAAEKDMLKHIGFVEDCLAIKDRQI